MKISIFGLGYVGCINLGCLAESGHQVIGVDINKVKVAQINSGKPTIFEKGIGKIIKQQRKKKRIRATLDHIEAVRSSILSLIAVGTPSLANENLDLRNVFRVAAALGEGIKDKNEFHTVVIRSTVAPGTSQRIAKIIEEKSGKVCQRDFTIIVNPEFLREGTALEDYYNPPITLIGTDNKKNAAKLISIYRNFPAQIVITSVETAEFIKYANNAFHALKVSFANEIGNICKEIKIDSREVMQILCLDKQLNISPYYLSPGFAYGGSCLPKDLKALCSLARNLSLKIPVLSNIEKTNEMQIERVFAMIRAFNRKKIGFLGLSFKTGTDDLRGSPAIKLIEKFQDEKNYKIHAYDANFRLSRAIGQNKRYLEKKLPNFESLIVPSAALLIGKSDLIVVSTREKEYMHALQREDKKMILDLVGLERSISRKQNYFGISW